MTTLLLQGRYWTRTWRHCALRETCGDHLSGPELSLQFTALTSKPCPRNFRLFWQGHHQHESAQNDVARRSRCCPMGAGFGCATQHDAESGLPCRRSRRRGSTRSAACCVSVPLWPKPARSDAALLALLDGALGLGLRLKRKRKAFTARQDCARTWLMRVTVTTSMNFTDAGSFFERELQRLEQRSVPCVLKVSRQGKEN